MPRIIKQKEEDVSEPAAMASIFQETEESLEFGILLTTAARTYIIRFGKKIKELQIDEEVICVGV